MSKRRWKRVDCHECSGFGIVGDYGNGEDFYGPKECKCCLGGGFLWRSRRGTLVAFPGGPFRGSDPIKPKQKRAA